MHLNKVSNLLRFLIISYCPVITISNIFFIFLVTGKTHAFEYSSKSFAFSYYFLLHVVYYSFHTMFPSCVELLNKVSGGIRACQQRQHRHIEMCQVQTW
jgi:hypothetical protein